MKNLNFLQKVDLRLISDSRGDLCVAELPLNQYFVTKRIYYISGVPVGNSRGSHGHKTLKQIFFALSGSFKLTVSDGEVFESITLKAKSTGYYLGSGYWRDLDTFTPNSVCLVLASDHFDATDYIHNFEEYRDWKRKIEKN